MKRLNEYWMECEKCKKLCMFITDSQCSCDQPERSKREDSSRMKRFKEAGLIGCLNDTGITSENYKDEMRCSEHCGNTVREVQ